MNPAKALLVPASDVVQALHDPDWLRTEPPEHPWIRVGVAGEWGFALDESTAGYGGYEDAAVAALAAITEVVLFTHTQTIDDFRYCVDGTVVTSFEPMRGSDRYGTEPDRFVGADATGQAPDGHRRRHRRGPNERAAADADRRARHLGTA